jgi:hypothetical protein
MNQNTKDALITSSIGISIILCLLGIICFWIPYADAQQEKSLRKMREEAQAQPPYIEKIDETTFRISFNHHQNQTSLDWLGKNNYKVISLTYQGRYNDKPVYIVSQKKD